MEHEFIGLNVGVLAIGAAATLEWEPAAQLALTALDAAGHHLVARRVVADDPSQIRAVLRSWIADRDLDVVVAIAGARSEHASSALAPLVTKRLAGFSDLFRLLAFETIGSSATLIDAEAAQCSSTIVFVLPASIEVTRCVLERLLIPQLDIRTKPRNLVTELPRVALTEHAEEATYEDADDRRATPEPHPSESPLPLLRRTSSSPPPLFASGWLAPAACVPVSVAPVSAVAAPDTPELPSWLINEASPVAASIVLPGLEPRRRGGRRAAIIVTACAIAAAAVAVAVIVRLQMRGQGDSSTHANDADREPREVARATVPASVTPIAEAPQAPRAPAIVDRSPDSELGQSAEPNGLAVESQPPRHHHHHHEASGTPPAAAEKAEDPATEPAALTEPGPPTVTESAEVHEPAKPTHLDTSREPGGSPEACDEVACTLDPSPRPCCAQFRTAKRETQSVAKESGLPDNLDRRMIQAGIAPRKQAVDSCGMRHAGKGTVRLHVRVDPSGSVTEVTVRIAPDEGLGGCVAAALRAATFARTSAGGSFVYPFVF